MITNIKHKPHIKIWFLSYRENKLIFVELINIFVSFDRIDLGMTIAEVRNLFQGNHDLILGLNIFLHEDRWLDKKMLVEYDRAAEIINSIKVLTNTPWKQTI